MRKPYMIIWRGKSDWQAEGVEPCKYSATGDRVVKASGPIEALLRLSKNGTPVVDAMAVDDNEYIDLVFKGPTLSVKQPEMEHIHSCGFVGIKTYVKLRRNLQGIRIGHVKNGSVVWE